MPTCMTFAETPPWKSVQRAMFSEKMYSASSDWLNALTLHCAARQITLSGAGDRSKMAAPRLVRANRQQRSMRRLFFICLWSVPSHLWRLPCWLSRNILRRRRGKRGGVLCRLKVQLALYSTYNARQMLLGLSSDYAGYDISGSVDYSDRWLLPAVPDAGYPRPCRRPVRIRRWRLRISVQLIGPPNRRIGVWFAWLSSTPDPLQIRLLS